LAEEQIIQEQCVKSECAALEESRGLLQTSLRVGAVFWFAAAISCACFQEALPKCPDDCSWKYFRTVGLCLVIGLLVLVPSGLYGFVFLRQDPEESNDGFLGLVVFLAFFVFSIAVSIACACFGLARLLAPDQEKYALIGPRQAQAAS